jgi:DNA-binding transcriptional LysR family regulator
MEGAMPEMELFEELAGRGHERLVRRGLKLAHLRLLAVLEETRQVSAAASQLALSQPAASRLLGELDHIAGAVLYRRHARGITLTESGMALARWARKIMRDLDAADREVSETETGMRGTVSIGAVTGPAIELVLPVLRQTRVTHPGIRTNVTVDTSDKLAELMLAERLDFFIGRIPQDFDHSQFAAEPIGEEPVSLVVRQSHPLMRTGDCPLEACVRHDWVLQAPGGLLRHTVETYLLERGLPLPARILSTSSTLMTLALISQSNAIAPVARAVASFFADPDGLDARIATLPAAQDLAVTSYSMLRPVAPALSPACQTIWTLIGDRVRQQGRAA